MLGFMILTVSDVERSLAFYEAALKPLDIRYFLPYKGQNVIPICGDLAMASRRSFGSSKENPDPASIHWGFNGRKQRQGR